MTTISDLIKEYGSGLDGKGPVLWHKKPHKNGSGEFACVIGIENRCENAVNCPNCYSDKTGGYCLKNYGNSVKGFLAVEQKHKKLIEQNAFGAYTSIAQAIENLR